MAVTDSAPPRAKPNGGTAGRGAAALVLPVSVLLLVAGMTLVVGGIIVPPLFRPGTWLILIALLGCAGGAMVRSGPPAGHG